MKFFSSGKSLCVIIFRLCVVFFVVFCTLNNHKHTKHNTMAENAAVAAAASAAATPTTGESAAAPVTTVANTETSASQESTEATPTKRDAWRERYKKRYAPEAEEFDMEGDDYYGNLLGMADEYDRMEGNERQMNDLLASNPSFGDMIRDAKEGKSFFPSLVERFGADNLRQALEDPAVAEELGKANDAYMQRTQQEAADKETAQRNFEESALNIEQYAKEHNLTDEQVNEVLVKATDFAKDIFQGKVTPDVIDMFYKSMNYDNDVAEARETGIVQGRNENIQAQLERSAGQPELPPNIGQSGTVQTEKRDTRRKGRMPLTGEEFTY